MDGNLILSRHIGERVQIGKDVVVTVEKVRGDRVTLSFKAPKELKVVRTELIEGREAAA